MAIRRRSSKPISPRPSNKDKSVVDITPEQAATEVEEPVEVVVAPDDLEEEQHEAKPEDPRPPHVKRLRMAVRYAYDLQKLRISTANRARGIDKDGNAIPSVLTEDDKRFLSAQAADLLKLEKRAFSELKGILKGIAIYDTWLKNQKGCGPAMGSVLVTEILIARADTVSALWAYCGLDVDNKTGKSRRRQKGEKANWNPFLRTKITGVLAGCMLKANSPWRRFFDSYRTRKENQLVPVCELCTGTGKVTGKKCWNCEGKPGPAKWGRGDAHRARASLRYMMKMFLQELWLVWRQLDGLPVSEPYAVAVLGRKHGDHGGMNVAPAAQEP